MRSFKPCLFVILASLVGSAYKEVPPPAKVILPPALSPVDSLAAIQVPAGFEVELVAAEPMVMDPIDIAWGGDGRMWVVEMADYPLGLDGRGQPGGRIRFLESTRGDEHYDKSTLFADGLRAPTSVIPWRRGVLVVTIPDIIYLEDTDGDGRADRREKIFSGLGEGNEQHLVNGLQWGLDGWLHMANGNSGGNIVAVRGGPVIALGQRDFRIQPDRGAIELLAGASQYGRTRDDWGDWFGCNNSNPIWHFALEERYLSRNPHLLPPNAAVAVASVPGAAPIFPRSATLARFNDPHGFNHFTSACGVMIYRDELLGSEIAGNAFVCEPVHNLVHREIIRPVGTSFRGERAPQEQTSEFFASKDHWSRFTAARAGPDGALYVVDMYRLVIEHPKWIPDAWQKELGNLRAGEKQGRIYRVRLKGGALRPMPRLDRASPQELIAALESPSGLVRDWAQQQVTWREEISLAPELSRLAASALRPATRAQALWTLRAIGALSVESVGRALRDPHPGVRRQAVQLSEAFAQMHPHLLADLLALTGDPDAAVRRQLAYALGEWPTAAAGVALAELLVANDDRFIRAAAMSSALPHAETLIAQLAPRGPAAEGLVMEIATATANAQALVAMLAQISQPRREGVGVREFKALGQLLDWLQRTNKSLAQWFATLGAQASTTTMQATDDLFSAARRVAGDVVAPVAHRVAAVAVLGRGRTRQQEDIGLLLALVAPQTPVELQRAAVAAVGRFNRAEVPDKLLAGWSGYGQSVRGAVLDVLMSRPAWAQVLLDGAAVDRALLAAVEPARRVALTQSSNLKLAERAAAIFNAGTDANRQQVIDRYLTAVRGMRGEAARGAEVFAATCSACHAFGAVPGRALGPDLAGVKDRSADYLITHVLDPNRAIEDRYVLYLATAQDGRTLAGMLTGESGNSLTLLGLDGTSQHLLRDDVRSLVSTTRSLMPDGLEQSINEQGMADLVAFLAGGGAGKN